MQRSSLPACVFDWSVENYGDSTVKVAIMLTWRNGFGEASDTEGGHQNLVFRYGERCTDIVVAFGSL